MQQYRTGTKFTVLQGDVFQHSYELRIRVTSAKSEPVSLLEVNPVIVKYLLFVVIVISLVSRHFDLGRTAK